MAVGKKTLQIFRSVRTSDVTDALDSMGLQQRYEMDPAMRPMYPGIRFAGIAHTAEYSVIDRPVRPMTYEEFDQTQYKSGPEGLWHEAGPWGAADEVLVIDAKRTRAGILGFEQHARRPRPRGGRVRHRRRVPRLLRVHPAEDAGVLYGALSGPPDGQNRSRGRQSADRLRGRRGQDRRCDHRR